MRNLQEQLKNHSVTKKCSDLWLLKNFANSQPSASNFKSFSQPLKQFFLTVGQNNITLLFYQIEPEKNGVTLIFPSNFMGCAINGTQCKDIFLNPVRDFGGLHYPCTTILGLSEILPNMALFNPCMYFQNFCAT